ncbi:MAG: NADP-specific glutamate dehydrogenase [Solobacterium sp.]|nr:NADP-specific glutamate dehydrogenase [Solobacterium sp.]
MNQYIRRILKETKQKNPYEVEYLQAVEEVFTSLEKVIDAHPEYEDYAILERLVEPDRIIEFRVVWEDDKGKAHVNRGYRIQHNSAVGPYKGGLRFHPTVNLSILKFLAFEQTFKNSLTTLPIGGAKGGSDFDPHGKSDKEIMRFCQAYMTELYRHIGKDIDVPAGDIGVGGREIGYLFGQYKRIRNGFENGVLTGKDLSYGGSLLRPEATGYGALYYIEEVFKHLKEKIKGKTFVISGYGNVAWGAIKKIVELGGKPVTISGHNGYVYDPEGITSEEKIHYLLEMRSSKDANIKMYADKFNCEFHENEKPWGVKADVCIPCATQNEVDLEDAKRIVNNKTKYYFEAANMPTTKEALDYLLENKVIIGPGKAVNAGGVAVSALEMSQNSMRYTWTKEEVDEKLHQIMKSIVESSLNASKKYGYDFDLIKGANIAGFEKVATIMMKLGLY